MNDEAAGIFGTPAAIFATVDGVKATMERNSMPSVQILETIVRPDASGALVQLQISDAPLLAEGAAIRLTLAVRVPAFRAPLLAHYHREAMKIVSDSLQELLRQTLPEIADAGYPVNPPRA